MSAKPTAERLRQLFSYSRHTGFLVRRITTSNRCPAGRRAGTLDRTTGYRRVNVDGRMYGEHQVIWCLVSGHWPAGLIDHRDGMRDNNRFRNLRDGSRRLNQENMRRARCDSGTGVQGVGRQRNGRSNAKIRVQGQQIWLGVFDSDEAAHEAYVAAKRQLHQGCTI